MKDFVINSILAAIAITVLFLVVAGAALLLMVVWGFLFMIFDWLFPGAIHGVVPVGLANFSTFSIGAMFGFFMFCVRALFAQVTKVSVNK